LQDRFFSEPIQSSAKNAEATAFFPEGRSENSPG
jgi:hypothetical protein